MLRKIRAPNHTNHSKFKIFQITVNLYVFPSRQRELVVAKFEDGFFYRACCLEVKEDNAKLYFIDYGSICSQDFANMMPLPPKLLFSCCTHTCKFILASGRDIATIDTDKTSDALMTLNEFYAGVEKVDGKFVLVLDDANVTHLE